MKVYHVTSPKKLAKCQMEGKINGPVRAWCDVFEAVRFSCSTGREIILRLKFPDDAKRLGGHGGNAVIINEDFILPDSLVCCASHSALQQVPDETRCDAALDPFRAEELLKWVYAETERRMKQPLQQVPEPEPDPCAENGCTDMENCDEICENARIYSPVQVQERIETAIKQERGRIREAVSKIGGFAVGQYASILAIIDNGGK